MVILEHTSNYQKCIKKTNIIPDYAREYRNEYLFIRGIDNLTLGEKILRYIEYTIIRLKNKSYEENWGKIIIYEMILIW